MKQQKLSILIVEDFDDFRFVLESFLSTNHEVQSSANLNIAHQLVRSHTFDLVLLDLNLPDGDGVNLIPEIKDNSPDAAIWIMSANTDLQLAVNSMKMGAEDYLIKPIQLEQLSQMINKLNSQLVLRNELVTLRNKVSALPKTGLIYKSVIMQDVIKTTHYFSMADKTTILISGETGTGKELIAEEIHRNSPRSDGPFIKVNCSAIPENLLESELFGHEKGSFTDAKQTKHGLFEQAHRGTLLLDEIGELSLSLQPKLLRILETKTLRRIGGTQEINVNVRVVASTNRNLKKMVEENLFRADLFHRLNVLEIHIPPLRERLDDILYLSHAFAAAFGRDLGVTASLTDDAEKVLLNHSWSGNVRELRNIIERAVILSRGEPISSRHLDTIHVSPQLQNKKRRRTDFDVQRKDYIPTLEEMNKQYVKHVLVLNHGNKSQTAKVLDITRNTLRDKLGDYENPDKPD